jgi:tetratricopeptide (TPR) repeat protein
MNKIILLLTFSLLANCATAQQIKTKQTVRSIVQQREIYLNGGARASVGGKSRTTIPIKLPEGTTSWYYIFSTSPGESGTKNLNLLTQLSSLALDPSGITKSALSNIEIPSGSSSIDVYLFDLKDSDLFLQKVDNDGGTFYFKREGSVFNTKQALVEITDFTSGTLFLGLKNPSTWDGIDIFIEVVAVIQEVEQQTEEQTEAFTLGNLGWKAFERGDYDKCIDLSKKALALDNTLGFVHFNLALSYLIKGQTSEATTQYTKAVTATKKSVVPKQTFEGAIGDLKNNMDKFPSKGDAQDILGLLVEEVKKY